MVNKQYDKLVITESLTDPSGAEHTGIIGEGGSGASWIVNGTVSANADVLVKLNDLTADQSHVFLSVTAVRSDGTALPSDVSLLVGQLDSGGEFMNSSTVVAGDGSTRHIDIDPDTEYSPSSDGAVGIIIRNDRSTAVDVYTNGTVETA